MGYRIPEIGASLYLIHALLSVGPQGFDLSMVVVVEGTRTAIFNCGSCPDCRYISVSLEQPAMPPHE